MPPPDDVCSGALAGTLHRQLERLGHRDDPDVGRLVTALRGRHGSDVAAVLLYGSYLRGKRDTLLDFYVLLNDFDGMPRLESWGNRVLPPNVYYLSLPAAGDRTAVRAKYATLTLDQFDAAMSAFDSYFWSRFTQPTGLVAARDDETARRVAGALARAVHRFVREVAGTMTEEAGAHFSSAQFWRRGLALTYGCELRSESPTGVDGLYDHHADHFDLTLAAYAAEPGAVLAANQPGEYALRGHGGRRRALVRWTARRVLGKTLSVLRLVKAAGTFDDPLDYLLWKIERHSGIYIAPTERQRRYPLIFAWGLLWRLYRRGAFR